MPYVSTSHEEISIYSIFILLLISYILFIFSVQTKRNKKQQKTHIVFVRRQEMYFEEIAVYKVIAVHNKYANILRVILPSVKLVN